MVYAFVEAICSSAEYIVENYITHDALQQRFLTRGPSRKNVSVLCVEHN